MARIDPQMKLRLPADLKAWVEDAAKKSNRSLNAEIVHRLEQSFSNEVFIKADDDMSQVNFALAMDLFEWKKELMEHTENDPNSTEAEKAIASHEFLKAEKHMRHLFASATLSKSLKSELGKRQIHPLPDPEEA